MKYKGIEITEVTEPQLFDPPKKMLVWDNNVECPFKDNVCAIVNREGFRVITENAAWRHCAEIPEVMCRRATNRELAKWLVLGNGQYQVIGGRIWTEHHYDIGQDDDACSKFILVRKWDDTEWHKPTREYLGLEDE